MHCVIRLLAIVCSCFAALQAGPANAERRVALVIGNAGYRAVTELPNPRKDARDIATALRAAGFIEVIEHHDLKLREMHQALSQFEDKAAGADWAVVYYAGHGIEVDGRNFLVPVDAELRRANDVEGETVALDRVISRVAAASKLQLVILDACRENPFKRRMVQAGAKRAVGERGLARIEPAHPNVIIAYAARDGEVALDGQPGQNSPYAKALLKHLTEPGLELGRFFRKVRADVLAETGGRQRPFEYGSLTEDLFFQPGVVPKPSGVPPPIPLSRAAAEWARVDKSSITELETFERRHPASAEAEYARARLKALLQVEAANKKVTPLTDGRLLPLAGDYGSLVFDGNYTHVLKGATTVIDIKTLGIRFVPNGFPNRVDAVRLNSIRLVASKKAGEKYTILFERSLPISVPRLDASTRVTGIGNLQFEIPTAVFNYADYVGLSVTDGRILWPIGPELKRPQ